MKFDPTNIHETVKKIQKQSLELDVINKDLKHKCGKKCKTEFPQETETKKSNDLELEEL